MPHIHEKIDFCAEVLILYNKKVLLRKHDKYKIWLTVGGHVELDEDPVEAAVREAKEEVGLDIEIIDTRIPGLKFDDYLITPIGIKRHAISDTHEHIVMVYMARAKTDKFILSETEKTEDCRWFSEADLETEDIHPEIKKLAQYALRYA